MGQHDSIQIAFTCRITNGKQIFYTGNGRRHISCGRNSLIPQYNAFITICKNGEQFPIIINRYQGVVGQVCIRLTQLTEPVFVNIPSSILGFIAIHKVVIQLRRFAVRQALQRSGQFQIIIANFRSRQRDNERLQIKNIHFLFCRTVLLHRTHYCYRNGLEHKYQCQ